VLFRGTAIQGKLDDVLQVCAMEEPQLERRGGTGCKRANIVQDGDGFCMQHVGLGRKKGTREGVLWVVPIMCQ
jgi:hypothetical protein